MKGGQTAAFLILLVDTIDRGTVKMHPGKTPEIVLCFVKIGGSAVDKDTIAYTERISIMCIMQLAGAGSYHKKEIGIQIFAFADMRFCACKVPISCTCKREVLANSEGV